MQALLICKTDPMRHSTGSVFVLIIVLIILFLIGKKRCAYEVYGIDQEINSSR